jgi:deoxyribodipyrimidine photo-lyase
VFNPVRQAEQFDPRGAYIRRWIPEPAGSEAPWIFKSWEALNNMLADARVRLRKSDPRPIVDHAEARDAALAAIAKARRS